MQGRPLRKLLLLALVAGVIVAVLKALRGEPAPQFATHPSVTGGPGAAAATPVVADAVGDAEQRWVEPDNGNCPDGYPVKAKLSSGIFHVPGGLAYDRTKPDRCYPTAEAAEADGLRASKR